MHDLINAVIVELSAKSFGIVSGNYYLVTIVIHPFGAKRSSSTVIDH